MTLRSGRVAELGDDGVWTVDGNPAIERMLNRMTTQYLREVGGTWAGDPRAIVFHRIAEDLGISDENLLIVESPGVEQVDVKN